MCDITHCVQNYTVVPFAFNLEKFPSLDKFYTDAGGGVSDLYQVCETHPSQWNSHNNTIVCHNRTYFLEGSLWVSIEGSLIGSIGGPLRAEG